MRVALLGAAGTIAPAIVRDLAESDEVSGLLLIDPNVDGAEAVRLAHELRPDIVLMDFVMPRVNGLEAMRRIKVERPETKVIIMTVHTEDAYRKAAEANGTDAFLFKNTLMTDLLPTIRRLRSSMSPPNTP